MLTTLILGITSSLVAELVTWINKKLSGTVIQGQGAFLFSLVVAFAIASVEVLVKHFNIDVSSFLALGASIFGVAQVWFYLIAQNLGLTVQAPTSTTPLQ